MGLMQYPRQKGAKPCAEPEAVSRSPRICWPCAPMRASRRGSQAWIDEKTNEIPVAKALLCQLPLAGRVCIADALHTHVALMNLLHESRAYSVLLVKQHEPTLYADLQFYFADPLVSYVQASTTDRRRGGRTEVRQIKVSTELSAYLRPR
jgi:hypothetical protein